MKSNDIIANSISLGNALERLHINLTGNSYSKLKVLQSLDNEAYLTPNDLAEQTNNDPSSISTLLSRMQKEELITREHDSVDRRKVKVSITMTGLSLLAVTKEPTSDFKKQATALIVESKTNNLR